MSWPAPRRRAGTPRHVMKCHVLSCDVMAPGVVSGVSDFVDERPCLPVSPAAAKRRRTPPPVTSLPRNFRRRRRHPRTPPHTNDHRLEPVPIAADNPLSRLRGRPGGGPLPRQRKRQAKPGKGARHAERPSSNPSRRAGGERNETPMSPALSTLVSPGLSPQAGRGASEEAADLRAKERSRRVGDPPAAWPVAGEETATGRGCRGRRFTAAPAPGRR